MENHTAPAAEEKLELTPETSELEALCAAVHPAVERAGEALEKRYYERLAEEALGPKWPNGKPPEETQALLDGVQGELDRLHQTSRALAQSYQSVVGLEDELSARVRDVRKSRDRKWYVLNPPANAGIDLEERRTDHFAQGINIYKILLVCIVGSFAGVIIEMMWAYARYGIIESRRGLVYGPFNLLYGAGAVFLTLTLYKYRNKGRIWSFLGGFIVGSVLEYACSWGQEMLPLIGKPPVHKLPEGTGRSLALPAGGPAGHGDAGDDDVDDHERRQRGDNSLGRKSIISYSCARPSCRVPRGNQYHR